MNEHNDDNNNNHKRKVSEETATTEHTVVVKKKQRKEKPANHNTIPISRGKFKQRYLAKHASLIKRSDTASGVMISCGLQTETRALGQAYDALLKQLAFYPSYEFTWTQMEGSFDVQDLDELLPKKEEESTTVAETETEANAEEAGEAVQAVQAENNQTEQCDDHKDDEDKKTAQRKHRTFQGVDTATGGLIFYRFRVNIKPTEFIQQMIERLTSLSPEEKQKEASVIRHCSRWVPLDYISIATTERIAACFTGRVLPECIADLPPNTTIAIVTEIRNNVSITKAELIDIIAPALPKHLKVDLKKPQYVIYVTIFKSVCGMSVLKDYYQLKKYNIGALLQ